MRCGNMEEKQKKDNTNGFAIASLVVALAGFFLMPLSSIAAIILGAIGLKQIRDKKQEGQGLAIAGIVVGVIELIISLIILLAVLSFIGLVGQAFTEEGICFFDEGVSCAEYDVGPEGVTLRLQNTFTYPLEDVTIIMAGDTCEEEWTLSSWNPGETTGFLTANCAPEEYYSGEITISYREADSLLYRQANGVIAGAR